MIATFTVGAGLAVVGCPRPNLATPPSFPEGLPDAIASGSVVPNPAYVERERVYLHFLEADTPIPQRPVEQWSLDTEKADGTSLRSCGVWVS